MSAHKFYAPKGIGALYVGEDVNFKQIQNGGHQEKIKEQVQKIWQKLLE